MSFQCRVGAIALLTAVFTASAAPATNSMARPEMIVTDKHRQYWSFLPLTNPPLPTVRNMDFVRTPVDRFILARLEEKNLTLSTQADARKLMERDRQAQGVGKQELYYMVLYPRERASAYPTVEQRKSYDRWFEGVALGYDIPGASLGKEK